MHNLIHIFLRYYITRPVQIMSFLCGDEEESYNQEELACNIWRIGFFMVSRDLPMCIIAWWVGLSWFKQIPRGQVYILQRWRVCLNPDGLNYWVNGAHERSGFTIREPSGSGVACHFARFYKAPCFLYSCKNVCKPLRLQWVGQCFDWSSIARYSFGRFLCAWDRNQKLFSLQVA